MPIDLRPPVKEPEGIYRIKGRKPIQAHVETEEERLWNNRQEILLSQAIAYCWFCTMPVCMVIMFFVHTYHLLFGELG